MPKSTSEHILGTSATLLGFCLVVITSFHVNNASETTIIDESTSIIAFLLSVSCICSFVSIRSLNKISQRKLETIADYIFMTALSGILIIILLITLDFVK